MPDLRLVVFIDAQNVYKGAREAFFASGGKHTDGQFDPMKLGHLIAHRGGPDGASVALQEVRVYTGRPDSLKQSKTYAAHMKQCAYWQRIGTKVIWRALRYPRDWPNSPLPVQEKGIDVALAIDFVTLALDDLYDIGVIMSTDTDLIPALEFVQSRYLGRKSTATAAWRSSLGRRRLAIQGSNVWCHWLRYVDYQAVVDPTDYNL